MAEITHPDYPGERLIACYNPFLEADRARQRAELLDATEAGLEKISAATRRAPRPLRGQDTIALAVGKVINKKEGEQALHRGHHRQGLTWRRDEQKIAAEAALDGIYVVRTSLPAHVLDTRSAVESYKALENVERVFRGLKTDLLIRPIRHRLADRVRAHVLSACSPTTSSGTCSRSSRPSCSKTTTPPPPGPPGPARSLPPAARPRRWPRTPPRPPPMADRAQPRHPTGRPGHHHRQPHPARRRPAWIHRHHHAHTVQRRAFELLGVSHRLGHA
jgi:hypothetical protein